MFLMLLGSTIAKMGSKIVRETEMVAQKAHF